MENLLQFFEYEHLKPPLREVSAHFNVMAHNLADILPNNPESTTMMRKLLEAKDCAVRSLLFKSPGA